METRSQIGRHWTIPGQQKHTTNKSLPGPGCPPNSDTKTGGHRQKPTRDASPPKPRHTEASAGPALGLARSGDAPPVGGCGDSTMALAMAAPGPKRPASRPLATLCAGRLRRKAVIMPVCALQNGPRPPSTVTSCRATSLWTLAEEAHPATPLLGRSPREYEQGDPHNKLWGGPAAQKSLARCAWVRLRQPSAPTRGMCAGPRNEGGAPRPQMGGGRGWQGCGRFRAKGSLGRLCGPRPPPAAQTSQNPRPGTKESVSLRLAQARAVRKQIDFVMNTHFCVMRGTGSGRNR